MIYLVVLSKLTSIIMIIILIDILIRLIRYKMDYKYILICLLFFFVHTIGFTNHANSITPDNFGRWLYIPIIYNIILGYTLHHIYRMFNQWEHNHISKKSIKEAFDEVPEAILIYSNNGLPILMNKKFSEIIEKVLHHYVRNGYHISRYLEEHNYFIQAGDEYYSFDEQKIDQVIQLRGINVTKQQNLIQELQKENELLQHVNYRLKEYNQKVDQLTKEEELLNAKTFVHNDTGRLLNAIKDYLTNPNTEIQHDQLIEELKKNIIGLKTRSQVSNNDPSIALKNAANFLNIDFHIEGIIPTNSSILTKAAREVLTYVYQYCNAKNIYLKIDPYQMEFTHDGIDSEVEIQNSDTWEELVSMIHQRGYREEVILQPQFKLIVKKVGYNEEV